MQHIFVTGEVSSANLSKAKEAEARCERHDEQGTKHMYFLQTRYVRVCSFGFTLSCATIPTASAICSIKYVASMKYGRRVAYSDTLWCSKLVMSNGAESAEQESIDPCKWAA